jgi:hypothetical protein
MFSLLVKAIVKNIDAKLFASETKDAGHPQSGVTGTDGKKPEGLGWFDTPSVKSV